MRSPEIRRDISGALVDENAPTGLDWLKAHGDGQHSWEQPQAQVHTGASMPYDSSFQKLPSVNGDVIVRGQYGTGFAGHDAPQMPFGNDATPHTNVERLDGGEQNAITRFLQKKFNSRTAEQPPQQSHSVPKAFQESANKTIGSGHDYARQYVSGTKATGYTPKRTPWLSQENQAAPSYKDPAADQPITGHWPEDSPLYQGAAPQNPEYKGGLDTQAVSNSMKQLLQKIIKSLLVPGV